MPGEQVFAARAVVPEAAEAESQLFFDEMLRRDLPVRNVVDSKFTFLNERLAVHYGVSGVKGVEMRRVDLPPDRHRAQASARTSD